MSKKNYNLRKSDFKKTNYFDQKDTPDGIRRQEIEDFNEYKLYEFEVKTPETTGETTNPWEQGRNCPKCAGRLVVSEFEQPDIGYHVKCTSCGNYYFTDDLEHRTKVVDSLYRTISDRTFNKWLDFKDKRL